MNPKGGVTMIKFYRFLFLAIGVVMLMGIPALMAQTVGDVVWEDHFDDAENDYLLSNVGWLYFGESDGLVGQEVAQTGDQTAWVKSGIFSSIIGASIIESNGFAYLDPNDMDGSEARMKAQNANIPYNQDLTFRVNFKKFTNVEGGSYPMGTFFICGTRMFNPDTGRGYGDPIADSTYVLYISPLTNTTMIAKCWGDLVILDPSAWTPIGVSTDFTYDLNVFYWVEFYLYNGDMKVKVWEGELVDGASEPWLIEATDPEPWLRGNWTEFGMLGDPILDGDELELDDVVLREITDANAIGDGIVNATPTSFSLAKNYPNPFNPETTIEFSLEKAGDVSLQIYAITGQLVRTIVSQPMAAGAHQVTFNGRDDLGNSLASGVYLYRLQNGEKVATNKMILMK